MADKAPGIIDLDAELAKLTMFHRRPDATPEERKGSVATLATYRDGLLLALKASGKDHWERHPDDELIHILDGSATLETVCDGGPPRSFELGAGTIAVIPKGAWHRFLSPDGNAHLGATPFPGEGLDVDIDDPRTARPGSGEAGPPSLVDLGAELAKLAMFRGRTPASTIEQRQGSAARLAGYRDGALLGSKWAGKGHWERHPAGDELVHIIEGAATLETIGDGGAQLFPLRAGMLAVVPQATWHRFHAPDGVTLMTATPFPSEVVEVDVDDPRGAGF